VVDVGNNGHVTDIGGLVHKGPDLVDREAVQRVKASRQLMDIDSGLTPSGV
jgi:hypothetical protein